MNNITDLLVDENTKPEERRVGLDPLSWQSKLSKGVTKFHYEIANGARPVSHQAGALWRCSFGLSLF